MASSAWAGLIGFIIFIIVLVVLYFFVLKPYCRCGISGSQGTPSSGSISNSSATNPRKLRSRSGKSVPRL